MPLADHEFIECPGCKQKLMSTATRCHFCGADTTTVARVAGPTKKVYSAFETPQWIKTLYVVLSLYWVVSGLLLAGDVLYAVLNQRHPSFDFVPAAFIFFGCVVSIVGVGLLLRLRSARNVANWAAFLLGLYSLRAIGLLFGAVLGLGIFGFVLMIWHFVDLIAAAGTIWLLSETETDFT